MTLGILKTLRSDLHGAGLEKNEYAIQGYALGYARALTDFAVWKDGVQYTAMGRPIPPILQELESAKYQAEEDTFT